MSLTPAQILYLHELALEFGGGAPGVLDVGRIEAAVARALQTAGGQPAYATPCERAAACTHALVRSHPFVDGNKRTAFLALGVGGLRVRPPARRGGGGHGNRGRRPDGRARACPLGRALGTQTVVASERSDHGPDVR